MSEEQVPRKPDPLLLPFLRATEEESHRHLDRLLKDADPVIRLILRRNLRAVPSGNRANPNSQEAEDVHSDAVLQLVTRLREARLRPQGAVIHDFHGFTATVTARCCASYLRKKYPQRASLKNQLSYLLNQKTGQGGFAIWEGRNGESLCGFAAWQGRDASRGKRYQQLLDHPQRVAEAALPREDVTRLNPAVLIAALFNWAGEPILLNDLVQVVGVLWGKEDAPPSFNEPDEERDADPYSRVPDSGADLSDRVIQRAVLEQLWSEVRQLSSRQCAALLLNLKDAQGGAVIDLLPQEGIATLRQIAELIALPAEQFAALWKNLPIDDEAIAGLIGATRQQVINLRKSARERLARRMKAFEK